MAAVLGLCACSDDKENMPPAPALAAAASSWHGIAVVKNQRMKRSGSGVGKPRRRVPLRDITNLLCHASQQPAPPAPGSTAATVPLAPWREWPVAAPDALTAAARRSLRKGFR